MIATRPTDAGFTLIETLVALAILAMSAVSLLGATEAHIARINALETRAAAQWVSENYLAELALGLSPSDDPAPMNGITFTVAATRTATRDPDLEQVEIVARDTVDGRDYGPLTGFVDTAAKQGGGS
jgi:general secretion pathway protein I